MYDSVVLTNRGSNMLQDGTVKDGWPLGKWIIYMSWNESLWEAWSMCAPKIWAWVRHHYSAVVKFSDKPLNVSMFKAIKPCYWCNKFPNGGWFNVVQNRTRLLLLIPEAKKKIFFIPRFKLAISKVPLSAFTTHGLVPLSDGAERGILPRFF